MKIAFMPRTALVDGSGADLLLHRSLAVLLPERLPSCTGNLVSDKLIPCQTAYLDKTQKPG